MVRQEYKTKIRAFISGSIRNYDLQEDDDIFALGFVNSLFAVQLVLFVEKEFKITIESEDLELDNFRTVNAITYLVERKTNSSARAS
jgi:methoxymalonate biosynthesis acyl carrier protein